MVSGYLKHLWQVDIGLSESAHKFDFLDDLDQGYFKVILVQEDQKSLRRRETLLLKIT